MIARTFAYQKPSPEGLARITKIREAYSNLAIIIEMTGTPSRELSSAITRLEESAMWAVKSVVHNDPNSEVQG